MVYRSSSYRVLWALCTLPGVALCLATLAGFGGRFFWAADLFSHFPVQYFVLLSLFTLLFSLGRRYRTAALFGLFAAVNFGAVVPFYFGRSAAVEGGRRLRAMQLNVNTRLGDPERVIRAVREEDPDIVVLEEIDSRWLRALAALADRYPHLHAEPRNDNFGMALLSKHPITDRSVLYCGGGVPILVAVVQIESTPLRVLAVHPLPPISAAYSHRRNTQLRRLSSRIPRFSPRHPVLLLGDLNLTPWNGRFKEFARRAGLVDSCKGWGVQPTWPVFNPLLRIPIDHCLHSSGIRILDRRIGRNVRSDHFPLIVDFNID